MREPIPDTACSGQCSCGIAAAPNTVTLDPLAGESLHPGGLLRSSFHIPGMDCPSEEQMIRLRLTGAPVQRLRFDLPGRKLVIDHAGDPAEILALLKPLGYGAELVESRPLPATETGVDLIAKNVADEIANDAAEGRVLKQLLAINGLMFLVEIGAGWLAHSAGLVADAMDMFADAAVYGVALYGVGRAIHIKLAAARLAGLFQFLLALAALATSVRHILLGAEPVSMAMIGIGGLALLANVACLLLIYRHRHGGIHMQASYIFSATDVIANLGVIVAGLLVIWSGNAWPDWIVGLMIGSIVLIGAVRILRLR
jgi:hypothetical protein